MWQSRDFRITTAKVGFGLMFKKIGWLKTSLKLSLYDCGALLSILQNFIQQSLNSISVHVQILQAACWKIEMVRVSENGPGWKYE